MTISFNLGRCRPRKPVGPKAIENMQPGESGWTVPWAVYRDATGILWLNGSCIRFDAPSGTVHMRVWRDKTDELWRVDLSAANGSDINGDYYAGDFNPLPVAESQS